MIAATLLPGHRFALGRGNPVHPTRRFRSNDHEVAPGGCPDRRPLVFTGVYEPHEARAAGAVYGRHRRVHMKRVVFGLVVASLVAVGVVWATPRKIPYRTALAVSDSRENTGNVKPMF